MSFTDLLALKPVIRDRLSPITDHDYVDNLGWRPPRTGTAIPPERLGRSITLFWTASAPLQDGGSRVRGAQIVAHTLLCWLRFGDDAQAFEVIGDLRQYLTGWDLDGRGLFLEYLGFELIDPDAPGLDRYAVRFRVLTQESPVRHT